MKTKLLETHGKIVRDVDVISASMYPKVTNEFLEFKDKYGPVDTLDTRNFLVGPKVAEEMEVGGIFHIRETHISKNLGRKIITHLELFHILLMGLL